MKIKSPVGFMALWSAFLAVGAWILPTGVVLTPAHSSPIMFSTSGNPWVGSEVEVAWRSATGQATDMQGSVISIASGSAEVPLEIVLFDLASEDAIQGSNAAWIPLGVFELLTDSGGAVGSDGTTVQATVVVRMIAGTAVGPSGGMGHFVGVTVEGSATMSDGQNETSSSAGLFFPVRGFETAELATAHLAGLQAAAENPNESTEWPGCGDGSAGINCHNPNWVGSNGWQCCRDQVCRDQMLALCDKIHAHEMERCVYLGFAGMGAVLGTCLLTKCKWAWFFPPLMNHCLAACLGVSVVTGYLAVMGCIKEADARREDCRGAANRWYFERLGATGCSPKPGASPNAMLEVISEQEVQLGDGLLQATE
ncbi:MAG: hypothetical protein NTU45_14780 [Planctomycetota bacterium]|jgi:hypothetical protein|nr:hypothetical protein [Planctomycetota bacterium]